MLLESMWTSLVAAVYALSAALVLILLLRVPIRQGFGARAAYALWSLVPASLLALCVPAPTLQRHWPTPVPMFDVPAMTVTAASATPVDPRGALVSAWIIGALVVLMAVGWRRCVAFDAQRHFAHGVWSVAHAHRAAGRLRTAFRRRRTTLGTHA
jgi:beta-lactamase regulating signal transducer with metallopeptidase domain